MQSEVMQTVCNFDNLYRAMWKASHNVKWKDSVAGYLKNGLVNCYKLKHSHEDGTYRLDPYTQFTVYEPKKRDIVSTRIKDRVFQRSYCDNYLYGALTRSFIYDNHACQIGFGTQTARNRLVAHMQKAYRENGMFLYVLKGDLTNYFGSTPHGECKHAVNKRCDDDWAVSEADRIIDSFCQGPDPEIGMGLGSQATQLIQLAVLDDLDHFIKERLHIKHYVRYMDDFILIHPSKSYLTYCKEEINRWLVARRLTLSVKKTQLFPIKQGIKFLGFRFRLTPTSKVVKTLLPEKVSRERRRLKKLVALAKAGVKTKAEVDECYQSWKAHAEYGNTHNLILRMDKYYKNLWRDERCSSTNPSNRRAWRSAA